MNAKQITVKIMNNEEENDDELDSICIDLFEVMNK